MFARCCVSICCLLELPKALDSNIIVLNVVADIGCIQLSFPAAQLRRAHLSMHWIRL